MSRLIEIIVSEDPEIKNLSLDTFCLNSTANQLIEECKELDLFRRENENLYFKVRALFFLYAIHRFHLPYRKEINYKSLVPFEAYEHMLKRRFEEAIDVFLGNSWD